MDISLAASLRLTALPSVATKNVSSIKITEGELKAEIRNSIAFDDWLTIDRRISHMAVWAISWGSKPDGQDYYLPAYGMELRYEWLEPSESLHLSPLLAYVHRSMLSHCQGLRICVYSVKIPSD